MISAKSVGEILALAVVVFVTEKWLRPWYKRLSPKVQDMILVVLAVNASMGMWWLIAWASGLR
ncbi:MAG: hypothetical protein V3S16_09665 [Candidatus Desulfatibia sp.]|uniref:hypothetical protein n=1 Tax=Candidatus Desulfatibia sp. TaxID=3101189 RepID=UPI002F30F8A2